MTRDAQTVEQAKEKALTEISRAGGVIDWHAKNFNFERAREVLDRLLEAVRAEAHAAGQEFCKDACFWMGRGREQEAQITALITERDALKIKSKVDDIAFASMNHLAVEAEAQRDALQEQKEKS